MMDMNSPTGKKILALIRDADYAHAGEKEAIDIVFKDIPKDLNRSLLDVGCGRGGTAHYVQNSGFGKVLGIDKDSESIDYAKKAYPDVEFMKADAADLAKDLSRRFDIIYLFNAFYAFSDHSRVLQQFRKVSPPSGKLIIFDYLLKSKTKESFPFQEWNPLDLSVIQSLFRASHWRVVKTDDLSALYEKWYRELTLRIEEKSGQVIALAGEEWLNFVRSFYRKVLEAVEKNILGGAVVYAISEI